MRCRGAPPPNRPRYGRPVSARCPFLSLPSRAIGRRQKRDGAVLRPPRCHQAPPESETTYKTPSTKTLPKNPLLDALRPPDRTAIGPYRTSSTAVCGLPKDIDGANYTDRDHSCQHRKFDRGCPALVCHEFNHRPDHVRPSKMTNETLTHGKFLSTFILCLHRLF